MSHWENPGDDPGHAGLRSSQDALKELDEVAREKKTRIPF